MNYFAHLKKELMKLSSQLVCRHSHCQVTVVPLSHQHTCIHLLFNRVNVSSCEKFLRRICVPEPR